MKRFSIALCAALAAGCSSPEARGLHETPLGTGAMVKFDMFHRPLPEIPLPNDLATRFDSSSPTGRRVNASLTASTDWEQTTRADIDALDGWSTYGSITVSFDKPLDVESIYSRHVGDDYDPRDDAVYVRLFKDRSTDPFVLRPELNASDGLHPSDAGYRVWWEALREQGRVF